MKTHKYPTLSRIQPALLILFTGLFMQASGQPNIVFILLDDLSHYGVSAYGAVELNSTQGYFDPVPVATPEIDRLAAEGILAGNAFAYPICEPTRIALMTGMNNHRNFIRAKALHESQITFGDLFKQAGYATGIAGKWKQSRGTAEIPGEDYVDQFGWDEIHCFDLLYEGRRHIKPNFVINGQIQWFNNLDPETNRRYYGPDLVNRFALDFIEAHQDEPFFLYYPMLLVHDEHTPTPDTEPHEVYDNFEVMVNNTSEPPDNEYGAFKGDDRRYFPDMMAYMDKMIGRVIDKLEQLDLREDTLIIVMGDNGTKEAFSYTLPDGSEFVGGKGYCKVNGLQVPLILSYPGTINPGTQYNGLINLTDLLPTICEAAQISLPNEDDLDGISFWPQVTGTETEAHREHIYTWYNANRAMTDQSKLLRYAHEIGFKRYAPDANFPEGRFFDLRSDPFEKTGDESILFRFNNWHFSGLDIATLTTEQRAAYDRLGEVLDANAITSVTGMEILGRAASISFSTEFSGSEGYNSGAIHHSENFHETTQGGMYLPSGQSPDFGTLKRSPTAGSSNVIYKTGEGALFQAGDSWTSGFEFTFEGLPNTTPESTVRITSIGFSTDSTTLANTIYAGIQKSHSATEKYQLYVFTAGGRYFSKNFDYSDIGDAVTDDNDLSDRLSIELRLTKLEASDAFNFVAILINLDTRTTVASISDTISQSTAYSSDLFAYFNTGNLAESNNFDLLNVDSFHYSTTSGNTSLPSSLRRVAENKTIQLKAEVAPLDATMRNVIWRSSAPEIATIDKFGAVSALQPGTTTISLYSWDDARPVSTGSSSTLSTSGIKDQITLEVGSDPSLGSIRPIEYIGVESASTRTRLWDGNSWGAGFPLSLNENQQLGLYREETGGDRYTLLQADLTETGVLQSQTGDHYLTGETDTVRFSPATWQNTTENNPSFFELGTADWGNSGAGTASPTFGFMANDEDGVEEINWILLRPDTTLAGNANAIALGILWYDDGDGILEDNGNDSCVIKYALSVHHPAGQTYAFAQMDTVAQLNAAVDNVMIDSDKDGMADDWESTHFGNLTTANKYSDNDLDGDSDFNEYRAGTIPTDSNSRFQADIQSAEVPIGDFDLIWTSTTGRRYSIKMTTDLIEPWTMLQRNIAPKPPTNTYRVEPLNKSAFYCIQIEASE